MRKSNLATTNTRTGQDERIDVKIVNVWAIGSFIWFGLGLFQKSGNYDMFIGAIYLAVMAIYFKEKK